MTVEIITPERLLFVGEVKAIQLPGKDGLFQLLDNHAPLIASLGKGSIKMDLVKAFERTDSSSNKLISEGQSLKVDISGGVVEVSANKAIVLVS
jgi:F-type H+-transporting ATPase subunit epsilon